MSKRFNPSSESSIAKLIDGVEYSRKQLQPFCENRMDMIRAYVGDSYGSVQADSEVILNMMELAVNIYQRTLASHDPAVIVDSDVSSLSPVANELTIVTNYVIKQLRLGDVLNSAVYDAMFGMGIVKVGITPRREAEMLGFLHDSGEIFCDIVDLADWVHDTNAKRWDQIEFCGNRYEVQLERLMESPLFDKKKKDRLYAMRGREDEQVPMGGDTFHPGELNQGNGLLATQVDDRIFLWDLWLPYEGLVITVPANNMQLVLRVVEWDGPERGPYHRLGFGKVPSNIMPLPPAALWENLNDLINRLTFKAANQADRQKSVIAALNKAQATMEAVIDAPDGMGLVTDVDPAFVKQFQIGGLDGNLMNAIGVFKEWFSYAAGNIDALGGLSPQSRTIGQDKLLASSASQRTNDMQKDVERFATDVCEDIAWYLWNDPLAEYKLKKMVAETIELDFTWNHESKEGSFFDYRFKVTPFSLQAQSPSERMQFIMSIVTQVILPMMPLLQQQGITFDIEEFLRAVSRLSNSPDIQKFIKTATGEPLNEQPKTGNMSPNTQRTYIRDTTAGGGQQQQPQFAAQPRQGAPQAVGA